MYTVKMISPDEDRYQKGRLMKFINNLEYLGRGIAMKDVDKRHLKHLIDVQLLIGLCS